MNVVIYVRVSSTEQVKGYSLEAQITELRQWCTQQGYTITRVFEEPGKSAKSDERPVFQKLITDIERGLLKTGAVVFHRVDRFARNLHDLLVYKTRLMRYNVKIYSATESHVNGESAEDEFLLHIFGALAQYDNAKRASEAEKGKNAMVRLGVYPGGVLPLGYIREGKKRQAIIKIDPETGPMIRTAFSEYATGQYGLREWAKEAKSRGYPGGRSVWGRLFRNIFYIGQFVWGGERCQGTHPALVTEEVFKTVQTLLNAENSGGKTHKHYWLFKGLLWSTPTARPMTGSLVGGKYPYYRAKGRGTTPDHRIRAAEVEGRVGDLLASITATGEPLPVTEQWEWGINAVDNMAQMWATLPSPQIKKQFLNLVFFPHGLLVDEFGGVRVERLKAGFQWREKGGLVFRVLSSPHNKIRNFRP